MSSILDDYMDSDYASSPQKINNSQGQGNGLFKLYPNRGNVFITPENLESIRNRLDSTAWNRIKTTKNNRGYFQIPAGLALKHNLTVETHLGFDPSFGYDEKGGFGAGFTSADATTTAHLSTSGVGGTKDFGNLEVSASINESGPEGRILFGRKKEHGCRIGLSTKTIIAFRCKTKNGYEVSSQHLTSPSGIASLVISNGLNKFKGHSKVAANEIHQKATINDVYAAKWHNENKKDMPTHLIAKGLKLSTPDLDKMIVSLKPSIKLASNVKQTPYGKPVKQPILTKPPAKKQNEEVDFWNNNLLSS